MTHPETLLATLSYVKRLSGQTILLKLGGATLEGERLGALCRDLTLLRDVGVSVVVVHGGGPHINAELEARGIPWKFIDGQRVTTPAIMEVIESVLGGTVNRRVVRALNLAGIPAVGLSGVEASTLWCRPAGKKLGQVGVIEEVDTGLIRSILKAQTKDGRGAVPVVAPIGVGPDGTTFNINADWAASRIAQSLGIKKLLFLTDQNGILDKDGTVLTDLDASELQGLIDTEVVKGGMLTKVRTIMDALGNGVGAIHIINGQRPHALVTELFTDEGSGTICRLRSRARATEASV
jgi:acetylglutamate kinase